MLGSLDSFFTDKIENTTSTQSNKILCIVEGGDELSFVKRVYEIYHHPIECQEFVETKIKLSYGKNMIVWQGNSPKLISSNKQKCNFQGGDNLEGKAPKPILESLYHEDLELYPAVIVLFDNDRDFGQNVEKKAMQILETHPNSILFVSKPCFEKETIAFFENEAIVRFIEAHYEATNKPPCQWYKHHYGKILKINPIGNAQNLSGVLRLLSQSHLEKSSVNRQMDRLIHFIQTKIREVR